MSEPVQRRRARRSRGDDGFTLIELMMSIVMLVVGILALATTMASITRYQDLSAARTDMATLADNKLEQLRAAAATRTADTLQLAFGGSLLIPMPQHVDTLQERGRTYFRRWVVAAGPGGTRDLRLRIRPLVNDVRTPTSLDFRTLILP